MKYFNILNIVITMIIVIWASIAIGIFSFWKGVVENNGIKPTIEKIWCGEINCMDKK